MNAPLSVIRPNFEKRGGLVVVITQDLVTKQILMLAYTDLAGYKETLLTGEAVYFSTSRNKRWKKGEESGDTQTVHDISVDCDGDAIIYTVTQKGIGACHSGAQSCFYRNVVTPDTFDLPAPKHGKKEELGTMEVEVHERLRP